MIVTAEKTGMRTHGGGWPRHTTSCGQSDVAVHPGRTRSARNPPLDATGLDVGCGPGHTAAAHAPVLSEGATIGVDFAPSMVERARERCRPSPAWTSDEDDAEPLSRPDASFRRVTSSFTLMYCYYALGAIAHAARVLRPNGRALFLVWGPHQDVWWSP